jgi:hypothetical protein
MCVNEFLKAFVKLTAECIIQDKLNMYSWTMVTHIWVRINYISLFLKVDFVLKNILLIPTLTKSCLKKTNIS